MRNGMQIMFIDFGDKYGIEIVPLNQFNPINPKWLSSLMDYLQEKRGEIIGDINKDFYDKDYFEGESKKSGLVDYDNFSKGYSEEHAKERIEKLYHTIYPPDYGREKKELKILEIGCAFGHTVDKLREMGYEAYGVDISEYAISKHKTDYKSVGDIRYDIFPNMPYDFIYGFNLMEHISELDLRETLRNFYANLTHGGIIFLTIDPVYGCDQSHQTIKPREWWDELFLYHEFDVHKEGTEMFKGINGHVYIKL